MGFPRLLLHSEQFCLFDMQEMYTFFAWLCSSGAG